MMTEWITVITLLGFGLLLVVVEIIFVPGTTVVGFFGFACMIAGAGFGFRYFGVETGWIILGITTVLSAIVLYYSFTSGLWKMFSLKGSSHSKVNEGEHDSLELGMEGQTISTLRPVGKAEINNKIIEVKTMGGYLDTGSRVRIVQIVTNQIIVEPIN